MAAVCLVLAGMTFAVFGQTAGFGFVNYDDDVYVYENPVVSQGLTLRGVAVAATYGEIGHWHPLTWISHMADCQIYGLWAGGHHLTNVALQAIAAALLFLALKEMTGGFWRSAFVAGVFAIHPLRVESVAWISERKDVLSGVFFMLTLWAYARYTRRPSRGRYAWVAIWFALGLLCKNTLVTLPFVLLLLDVWPLQRAIAFKKLAGEKIPLFVLSIVSCIITVLVPETISLPGRVPFLERIANALVSYGIYLRQMVFPTELAIPYLNPPGGLPFWEVGLSVGVLAAVSITVVALRKSRPYLLIGWLWYLGMLVPMLGIAQISYYAHADRYTYLPEIGIALAVTWGVGDISLNWKCRRMILGSLIVAIMVLLMARAWRQTRYWRNSETLWAHTVACTTDNYIASYSLGNAFLHGGKVDEARACYEKALQIRPDFAEAHYNLGNILLQSGKVDEAIAEYRQALTSKPTYAEACNNLGNALLQSGKVDQAIAQYQAALEIKPNYAEACNSLGNALLQTGKVNEAIAQFQKALQINPALTEAHFNFGVALDQEGKVNEAIPQYRQALELTSRNAKAQNNLGQDLLQQGNVKEAMACFQGALQIEPANPLLQNNLAWLLATASDNSLRNGSRAVELARQADALTGGENPIVLRTLAAAYAEAGQFGAAVDTARQALRQAEIQSNKELVGALQSEIKFYQADKSLSQRN
jgi:tetratricopeptide (TPR) repeat protein